MKLSPQLISKINTELRTMPSTYYSETLERINEEFKFAVPETDDAENVTCDIEYTLGCDSKDASEIASFIVFTATAIAIQDVNDTYGIQKYISYNVRVRKEKTLLYINARFVFKAKERV